MIIPTGGGIIPRCILTPLDHIGSPSSDEFNFLNKAFRTGSGKDDLGTK